MKKILALSVLLLPFVVAPASAKAPSGTINLTVSGTTATTSGVFSGVPGRSHPEVFVQVFDANGNSIYGNTSVVTGNNPSGSYSFDSFDVPAGTVDATLFYYTWQGQQETGTVVLATTQLVTSS